MTVRLLTYFQVVAIALLAASPLSASDADMTTALETKLKTFKTAFAKKDGATIKNIMTKDGLLITPFYGVATADDVMAKLDTFKIDRHTSYNVKVTPLGADDALMTLYTDFEGTFDGKPLPAWVFASAVWIKQDGAWRVKLYQETVVNKPAKIGKAAGN